ncbi:MAG: O-antigen ligase family protein [Acidobacteriota bacterium]|nr:O-antigen ligase family protein [Acidobacteriota bacterium]
MTGAHPSSAAATWARRALLTAFIVAMPITGEFALGGKRMNLAASDLILPLGVAFLLWRAFQRKLVLPSLGLCCFTAFAIVVSLIANFSDTLAAKGLIGVAVETLKILSLWLQFYICVNAVESRDDFRLALKTWLLGSAGVSAIGIYGSLSYQMTGVENDYALMFRAQGTLGDANLFASYLALSIVLGILLWQIDPRSRKWIVPVMGILAAGIFFSASRGTMMSLSCVLALLAAVSMSWRARFIAAASVFVVVAAVAAIPGRDDLLASTPYTERLATATTNVNDEAASDRKQLWDDAWERFRTSPLFGVGRGNFRPLDEPDPTQTGAVHDTFLGIAAETGILGVAAFALAFSRYAIALAMDRWSRRRSFPLATRVMLCALLILMLCGITISIENFRGVWILIALMEAYRRLFGAYGLADKYAVSS